MHVEQYTEDNHTAVISISYTNLEAVTFYITCILISTYIGYSIEYMLYPTYDRFIQFKPDTYYNITYNYPPPSPNKALDSPLQHTCAQVYNLT